MKRLVFLSLSLLLLILIPGCIIVSAPSPNPVPPVVTPPVPPIGTPPVIGTFSSSPSTINPGGTSTLTWNVTGANSVNIDQGIGQVNASGTMVVSPATSTFYTISATNSNGTVTRSSLTTVNSALAPPAPIPFSETSGGALLVTGIVITVDPNTYTGACPTTVNFWATITTNGPGTITYRWERSDGSLAPVQSITFASAGEQTVSTTWTRGAGTGWQRLHVLTPRDAVSNQTDFTLTCVP